MRAHREVPYRLAIRRTAVGPEHPFAAISINEHDAETLMFSRPPSETVSMTAAGHGRVNLPDNVAPQHARGSNRH